MKEEIIEIVRDILYLRETIGETTKIKDIVQDSMDTIELIAVLSNRYKIAVRAEQLKEIETVGDLVRYVMQHQGEAKSADGLESF